MSAQLEAHGEEVLATVEAIKPLLAGRGPMVQSAVLAELLGLLLAGHWIPGEPEQTKAMRQEIFSAHCALVLELASVSAKMMGTDR